MRSRVPFLFVVTCFVGPVTVRADELQKLRSRGAEVYYLDSDLRAAFTRTSTTPLPEARRKLPKATAVAFDWTTLVQRPYSYTQKVTPYCWAFAAVTAFEWNWAIRNGGAAPVVAVQPIIDHSKEKGGAPTAVAFEMLLAHGSSALNSYPYTGKPDKVRPNVPMTYRAIAWGRVDATKDIPEPSRIKQALLEQGPLVASVYASPLFERYKGGVVQERFKVAPGEQSTNHAIVIVGWDDRKGRGGAWKVQNSWGPKWGEGGYMWIEYGSNSVGTQACWVRAQSNQYQLPANANKLITGDIAPFHRWARAVAVTPAPEPVYTKVTPEEAIKKKGQRVDVQFEVKSYGLLRPTGHLELRSEKDPRDEQCLMVRILKSELHKFPTQDERKLFQTYAGKKIRVRGSVQAMGYSIGTRMVIEVGDPERIEIVE